MKRMICMFVCLSLFLSFNLTPYASEHLIPPEGDEYQEILSMKDDVLSHINHGGARTELNRNVRADEVKIKQAYKVYANSERLKAKDIKDTLETSSYNWQIPVYTDGFTVLVDITKVTSIPDDIPEDTKEMLKDDLNHWTVGAVYVYATETVDYVDTVTASLDKAGYNSDEYSYEIVSGIPGIRYPVAIIFNANEEPEFIIPAQKATTHAFHGEWPTAAKNGTKTAVASNAQSDHNSNNINAFPIYYYDDVVRASNSCNQSGIGLSYKKGISKIHIIAVLIFGAAGVLLIVRSKKERRTAY